MKSFFSLFTLYAVTFAAYTSFSSLYPVMPLYAAELGAPVSQVGLIVASTNYATASLLIPLGILSDKFGRRTFLTTGLVVFTLAPLLYPLATTYQQLFYVRVIHGLSQACFLPSAFALAVDLAPASRRGEALGFFTMSLHIGLMTGPVTGGFLLSRLSFEAAFYGCSAISMLGLVFILFRFGSISTGTMDTLTEKSSWSWLKQRPAIAGLLAYMFVSFGTFSITTFIPLYGKGFGIAEAGLGLIITTLFASSAFLRALTGRLSDKIGRKPVIFCGFIICATAAALISQFDSLSQLIPTAICFGIGVALASPAIVALIADSSSAKARGLSMGVSTCLYQAGQAIGPTIMGFIAETSNFETMFLACGASLALVLFVFIGLSRGV